MQKREDSCDLYFWEVADVGECNYADYLVSRGIPVPAGWGVGQVTEGTAEEEDAEQEETENDDDPCDLSVSMGTLALSDHGGARFVGAAGAEASITLDVIFYRS